MTSMTQPTMRAIGFRGCVAALLLCAVAAAPRAASTWTNSIGGSYELDAQVIAAGGASLSGANGLSADTVIGQNNAASLSGANGYSAATGFWSVAVRGGASERIFSGGFEPAP